MQPRVHSTATFIPAPLPSARACGEASLQQVIQHYIQHYKYMCFGLRKLQCRPHPYW